MTNGHTQLMFLLPQFARLLVAPLGILLVITVGTDIQWLSLLNGLGLLLVLLLLVEMTHIVLVL